MRLGNGGECLSYPVPDGCGVRIGRWGEQTLSQRERGMVLILLKRYQVQLVPGANPGVSARGSPPSFDLVRERRNKSWGVSANPHAKAGLSSACPNMPPSSRGRGRTFLWCK